MTLPREAWPRLKEAFEGARALPVDAHPAYLAEVCQNERKAAAFCQDKMEQWYRAAGAIEVVRNTLGTMGPSTHAYGGTRMGRNPETNVVNEWGFSHEVPNLGILGASVMGTSGARNPTLTAQALAWRTARHLVQQWKTIASS